MQMLNIVGERTPVLNWHCMDVSLDVVCDGL